MSPHEQAPDPEWQLTRELWQALGRLVCAAANTEMWLRNCYYSLRPQADGPASAEGETCEKLITMCKESAGQRTDFDPVKLLPFVAALEDLRAINKKRNRLFHDSWSVHLGGKAMQSQSLRKTMPTSRDVTTADVIAVEQAMEQTISRVIIAWFSLDSSRDLEFYQTTNVPMVRRRLPHHA